MRDFDDERSKRFLMNEQERSFRLGGHVFVGIAGGVRPEDTFEFIDALNGRSDLPEAKALELYDYTVKLLLEPAHHAAWDELRARTDQPLLAGDIVDVVLHLMAVTTGRPTEPSSPSSNGRVATTDTTPSTPASPSPALVALPSS